jgi:hypothetical protein
MKWNEIDNHLNWKNHFIQLVPKISGVCYVVRSMLNISNTDTLKLSICLSFFLSFACWFFKFVGRWVGPNRKKRFIPNASAIYTVYFTLYVINNIILFFSFYYQLNILISLLMYRVIMKAYVNEVFDNKWATGSWPQWRSICSVV